MAEVQLRHGLCALPRKRVSPKEARSTIEAQRVIIMSEPKLAYILQASSWLCILHPDR
jgi:hypothetical protein